MIRLLELSGPQRGSDLCADAVALRHAYQRDVYGMADPKRIRALDPLDGDLAANLLSLSAGGKVDGALRLLQTTGPHSLSELIPEMFEGDPPPRSPCLWEISRICIDQNLPASGEGKTRSNVIGDLLAGAMEMAIPSGVRSLICIVDYRCDALLDTIGPVIGEVIARKTIAGCIPVALWVIDCNPASLAQVRAAFAIEGNIWIDEPWAEERVLLRSGGENLPHDVASMFRKQMERHGAADFQDVLRSYCDRRIQSAKTGAELQIAHGLMASVLRMMDIHEGRKPGD